MYKLIKDEEKERYGKLLGDKNVKFKTIVVSEELFKLLNEEEFLDLRIVKNADKVERNLVSFFYKKKGTI